MRRIVLLAGVTAFLLAAGAAGADEGSGWIAFTTSSTPGQVVVASPDGSTVQAVSPAGLYASDPAWSPDGSRLAFALNPGSGAADIFTARPDGSDLRRLTNDAVATGAVSGVGNIQPSFSPDGQRLAFVKVVTTTAAGGPTSSDFDVWTVGADGTSARRITADGGDKRGVAWQPNGLLLAYNHRDADGFYGLYVVSAAGGPPARVGRTAGYSFPVAWSPDGTRLAFLDAAGHPAIVSSDGSGFRELTSRLSGAAPTWSPDGTSVVYGGARVFPTVQTRYGPFTTTDVFSFDLAGGVERRLTGDLDESSVFNSENDAPFFWPDGSRIFFRAPRGGGPLWMMNPDGTCEEPWKTQRLALVAPVWQPGARPGLGGLSCADIRVHGSVDLPAVALDTPARATVVVENDGNLTAADVRVTVTADRGGITSNDPRCTSAGSGQLSCRLDPLGPESTTSLVLELAAATAGAIRTSVVATTTTADPTDRDNTIPLGTTVLPCSIAGTSGADALWGTPGKDHICGLPGADHIYGRAGADDLDGGSGDDVITGGPGRDVIRGGGGRDVILARDGRRDTIDCGSEPDVAVVDKVDRVTNCERVLR